MEFLQSHYLYLGLLLLAISYPLAQSFEKRLQYVKKWKFLFPAIGAMSVLFIPWDIWFASEGVWWFDERYITGLMLGNLPVEECLFFLAIPFACVFIHEVLKHFVKKDVMKPYAWSMTFFMGVFSFFMGIYFYQNIYTFIVGVITGIVLLLSQYYNPPWLGRFWLTFIVSIVPFLCINGVLTGSWIEGAVVNYNPDTIIGFRIGTIPFEDLIYSLLMQYIVIALYEKAIIKAKGDSVTA